MVMLRMDTARLVVASIEVLFLFLVMPYGLLYVISGILAGGIPGFRIVLCCFTHSMVWQCVKTRERRGSSFSQLGLEPNHTGLTAQSLFFLEESCRVKRSDTQTSSNFSNYFKRVLKLQKRSSSFSK